MVSTRRPVCRICKRQFREDDIVMVIRGPQEEPALVHTRHPGVVTQITPGCRVADCITTGGVINVAWQDFLAKGYARFRDVLRKGLGLKSPVEREHATTEKNDER